MATNSKKVFNAVNRFPAFKGLTVIFAAGLMLALVLMLFSTINSEAKDQPPTLETDKADYAPGEVVHVTGSGFEPNTQYAIPVMRPDGSIVVIDPVTHIATPGWDVVTSDSKGDLTYDYQLNGVMGLYTVRSYPHPWDGDWSDIPVAEVTFTDAAIGTYDQCSNDLGDGYGPPDEGCRWVNGNLNVNNSRYTEGDATVQRLWLTEFVPGSTHTVTFIYGTTKGGKHAYDFLTTWDWSESWITVADRCQDITGCVTVSETTLDIPVDPNAGGFDVAAGTRQFVMRGGTLNSATTPIIVSGTYTDTSETSITISFTVANSGDMCSVKGGVTTCDVAIWFGAHVSRQLDWGPGTSAVNISGSPYHVALSALDGSSIGQRDNQMQASAVLPNGTITIIKDAIPDDPQDFNFEITGPSIITPTFSLDDDPTDTTLPVSKTFIVEPGNYTAIEVNIPLGWSLTNLGCTESLTPANTTTNVATATANIVVDWQQGQGQNPNVGENVICTYTDTRVNITPTIVTTPNPALAPVGTLLNDSAVLSGGLVPTGSITFNLYPPSDATCTGPASYTETLTVNGNGTYNTTTGFTANAIGVWRWTAAYSGDVFNNPVSSGCQAELVSIFTSDFTIAKTGDTLSKIGDQVTYTFTITNTSSSLSPNLNLISINDTRLGDLAAAATAAGCDVLTAGETCSFQVTHTIPVGAPDPYDNEVTAVYQAAGFAQVQQTHSDQHSVNLFQPSVTVVKTGDTLGKVGDPVDYTITVTNTGSVDSPALVNGTIVDDLLGDLLAANSYVTGSTCTATLATGASCTITATRVVSANDPDPLPNTVTVHYNPQGFPNDVTASDSHSVELFQPVINLVKTGDTLSKATDPVTYTITLSNLSSPDTPPMVCAISDPTIPFSKNVTLASGASDVSTVPFTIPQGAADPFVNTASVNCSPTGFTNVFTDTASHSMNLFQPSVTVVKTGDTLGKVGDPVNYTITVTNTGTADSPALVNGTIIDSLLGDLLDPANTFVTNSTCTATLATGASCTITATRVVSANDPDPLPNTVTVHYNPQGFPNDVTASDSHSVDLFQPVINLTKTGDQLSKATDPVTYTITLSNTSSPDTPDLVCAISDPTIPFSKNVTLASGASDVSTVPFTIPQGAADPFVNTASVTCSPTGFTNVFTDTASHSMNLFQPSVDVVKTGDTQAKVGDPVNYTITVTNTGSADSPALVNGTIIDSLLGDLLDPANTFVTNNTCTATLATGASCTITATRVVLAGDPDPLPNTVTVHYNPQGFPNDVTDFDDHLVDLFQPGLLISKIGEPLSKVSDPISYTITVTNTSSIDTPDLACVITDPMLGFNQQVTLPPGQSTTIQTSYIVPTGAPDPLTNTATANCTYVGTTDTISDSTSYTTNLFQPSVTVVKTGDALGKVGDPVDYTITVTNTSSADSPDLVNGTIVDDLLGDLLAVNPYVTGSNCTTTLATGASCTITATRVVTANDPDPLPNTVTVHYNPQGFPNDITATASHSVELFQAAINLTKTGDPLSKLSDPVTYTITLSNLSSPDTPPMVCTISDPTIPFSKNVTLGFSASDVSTLPFTIPPGATDPFVNTASVTCSPTGFTNVFTDTASHSMNLFQPSVDVIKTGDTQGNVGEPVNYTITVTNTSSADSPALVNGTIIDSLLGNLLDPANPFVITNTCTTTLAVGASCSITASRIVQVSDPDPLPNTVTVHYNPQGFPNDITDADDHSVDLFQPSITLTKTGDVLSKVTDPVNYMITLTNTSSVGTPDLVCTITDQLLGINQQVTLASGQSTTLTPSRVVQPGDPDPLVNTVSASCVPIGSALPLTATASHTTNLFQPAVDVQKTGDLQVKVGELADYTITVINISSPDSPGLVNGTIVDSLLGNLLDPANPYVTGNTCTTTLATGASCTITAARTVQADDPDPLPNTVVVHYNPTGFPNDITDSASHSVDVVPLTADLGIIKVCPGEHYPPTILYEIKVTNYGPDPAVNVNLIENLPPGTSYNTHISNLPATGPVTVGSELTFSLTDPLLVNSDWIVSLVLNLDSYTPGLDLVNTVGTISTTPEPNFQLHPNQYSCESTQVSLASFKATQDQGAVTLEWTTSNEVGNVGFNLYVEGAEGRIQLNQQLIPSQSLSSFEPQSYNFVAAGITDDTFFVEEVDVLGQKRMHGPFKLDEVFGSQPEVTPVDWAAINTEQQAFVDNTGQATVEVTVAEPAELNLAEALGNSPRIYLPMVIGSGNAAPPSYGFAPIDLQVSKTGLYRLTYEELLGKGFNLTGATTSHIAMVNKGNPVAIRVVGPASFGPGAYIEFYGEAIDTIYTRTNIYTLLSDPAKAMRVTDDATAPQAGQPAGYYMETATVDNNSAYGLYAPSYDPWFEKEIGLSRPTVFQNYISVDGYQAGAAPATLELGLWGATDFPSIVDHHLVVKLNNTQLSDFTFDGIMYQEVALPLASGGLINGSNLLQVTDTSSNSIVAIDRYQITYPRAFNAKNGVLMFTSSGSLFQVNSLPAKNGAAPEVVVYRIGGGGMTRLTQVQLTASGGSYQARFTGNGQEATYIVSTSDALLDPSGVVASRALVDITSGPVELLIISYPSFIQDLSPLVQTRLAQGYSVKVVDVRDVYDQYSHKIFDPNGIQAYIADAYQNMGTRYVLLVGGDTYDYLNYSGVGSFSFIPSPYGPTHILVKHTPLDALYADVNHDGVQDLAIGRFPVRTKAELQALVAKTLAYGQKDYAKTAVYASDAKDDAYSYSQISDELAGLAPADWTLQKSYLDNSDVQTARQILLGAINHGVALVNYIGHSADIEWTAVGLFKKADVPGLTNILRPAVFTQWGCWNTYTAMPAHDTLAHALLVSGNQGGAAVVGSSSLTSQYVHDLLSIPMMPYLMQPGMTIGDAILTARQQASVAKPYMIDALNAYQILGDPTLVVQP